jgi:hypothetical protein
MSANLTNNNKYYNLSAQSLKLNDLDVQQQLNDLQNEINNLSNENNWTNTNSGSVQISTGLVITTNGIEDGAVANEQIEITESSINLNNNVSVLNDLYCNQNLSIQSNTSLPVSMFMDPSNNFIINNSQSSSQSSFLGSNNYFFDNNIETSQNVILNQGKSLTLNNDTDVNNIKLFKANGVLGSFVLDNQSGSKTDFRGASSYLFSNDLFIGDNTTSKKLYLNNVEITPSGGGLSAGVLRALNINQIVPTVAQTYDVIWSNLTPAEQAIWAGGSEPPVASATGNYWNFTKLSAGTQKINWTLPFDFLTANLKFQEIQSVYAIVRLNTSSNISAEGYMWFQIQSQNIVPDPPLYRSRWNYANSASGVISQLGNTYKIYASDSIPLSTAASNTGKGQEPYPLQSQFKSNPVDIEPTSLFSIPFSKFVASPSGDTSAGYTSAFVQSIALNTASNINTYNFDLIAIGFNSVRYNLFFA